LVVVAWNQAALHQQGWILAPSFACRRQSLRKKMQKKTANTRKTIAITSVRLSFQNTFYAKAFSRNTVSLPFDQGCKIAENRTLHAFPVFRPRRGARANALI
jgi:hypothetical protein